MSFISITSMRISLQLSIFILNLLNSYVYTSVIVELNQGKVQGFQSNAFRTGKSFYSFLGIPYGKPPINELRFQDPVPVGKWQGIFNANSDENYCIQCPDDTSATITGTEDCLNLNVYTPELPSETYVLKPTMVYFHGGSFSIGDPSRSFFGADYLINYEIVLVVVAFRLHALGFMNMGIRECTGNFGLKDQILALKWVKSNIEKFGGNPENITVFGESAGGSSAHYHLVSPLSKNLFHKAILESGNAWSPWGIIPNPEEMGFKLARILGFEGNDKVQLMQYLKYNKTAEDITEAACQIRKEFRNTRFGITNNYPFIPSVEVIKENAFLPDHPARLPFTQSIPVISGINDKEGQFIFIDSSSEMADKLQQNFSAVISYNFHVNNSLIPCMANAVRKYYFGDQNITHDTDEQIGDMFTDLYFLNKDEVDSSMMKSNFTVYTYNFVYEGNLNLMKSMLNPLLPKKIPGAIHDDETGYLFYISFLANNDTDECDFKMVDIMCRLWTNFAKTGNPTYDMEEFNWKPSTIDQPTYLQLSTEPVMINGTVHESRISFWNNLLRYYNAVQIQSPYLF